MGGGGHTRVQSEDILDVRRRDHEQTTQVHMVLEQEIMYNISEPVRMI
jgi:hypothetical protein